MTTLTLAALVVAGCGNRFTGPGLPGGYGGPRHAGVQPAPVGTAPVAVPAVAFGRPAGLAYDRQGQLLVANDEDGMVMAIGQGNVAMSRASGLKGPRAVATDRQGAIYVADARDGSIVKLTASQVKRVATGIDTPTGVAVASDGTIYVSSPKAREVFAISPEGQRETIWSHEGLAPEHVVVTGKDEIFVAVRAGDKGQLLELDRTGKKKDTYYFDHPLTAVAAGPDDRLFVAAASQDADGYLWGDLGWLDRDGTWTITAENVIDPLALAVSPAGDPVYVQYDWDSDSYQLVTMTNGQASVWLKSY